jgi:hypothetical protein
MHFAALHLLGASEVMRRMLGMLPTHMARVPTSGMTARAWLP